MDETGIGAGDTAVRVDDGQGCKGVGRERETLSSFGRNRLSDDREKTVRVPVQKRGKEKKARIIEAAMKLFGELGYDETNTNKIAREAGVSVGSLYAYFRDKRDIFLSVVDAFTETSLNETEQDVREMLERARGLEEVFDTMIRRHKARHDRHRALHKVIMIQSLKDPEVSERFYADEERAVEMMRSLLAHFPDQVDIEDPEAVMFVMKVSVHHVVHELVFGEPGEIDHERVMKQLVRMLCRFLVTG